MHQFSLACMHYLRVRCLLGVSLLVVVVQQHPHDDPMLHMHSRARTVWRVLERKQEQSRLLDLFVLTRTVLAFNFKLCPLFDKYLLFIIKLKPEHLFADWSGKCAYDVANWVALERFQSNFLQFNGQQHSLRWAGTSKWGSQCGLVGCQMNNMDTFNRILVILYWFEAKSLATVDAFVLTTFELKWMVRSFKKWRIWCMICPMNTVANESACWMLSLSRVDAGYPTELVDGCLSSIYTHRFSIVWNRQSINKAHILQHELTSFLSQDALSFFSPS